jgi:hypothetical protein
MGLFGGIGVVLLVALVIPVLLYVLVVIIAKILGLKL